MAVVVAANIGMKLAAVGVGFGIALIGLAIWLFGKYLTGGLNKLYAALPGRFQYPTWWPRAVGGFFIAFGVLILAVGAAAAGR